MRSAVLHASFGFVTSTRTWEVPTRELDAISAFRSMGHGAIPVGQLHIRDLDEIRDMYRVARSLPIAREMKGSSHVHNTAATRASHVRHGVSCLRMRRMGHHLLGRCWLVVV